MTAIEQLPATVDVSIRQGDSWVQSFVFRDKATHTPVNVSTWQITAQIRRNAASDAYVALDIDKTAAATGTVTVRLSAAHSATLAARNVWDLQRIDDSDVRTMIAGAFVADRQVTR